MGYSKAAASGSNEESGRHQNQVGLVLHTIEKSPISGIFLCLSMSTLLNYGAGTRSLQQRVWHTLHIAWALHLLYSQLGTGIGLVM